MNRGWFKRGVPNVNKGKRVPKIGDALRGRKRPLEFRQKISATLTGRKKSAEHCRNISLANKGRTAINKGQPGYNRGGLTSYERQVLQELEARHKDVVRGGWPDFIVVPHQGRPFAVEVKAGSSPVKSHQRRMHQVLEQAGIEVVVLRLPSNSKRAA